MNTALKAALIWLCIACLAILNGLIRDFLFAPLFGTAFALPLSGISLAVIVFAVTYLFIGFIGATSKKACFLVGTQWILMTLAFELLFGHFLAGKSWGELLQVFNLFNGDLFLLVLLVSLFSPYVTTRIRGHLTTGQA
jgi:hypothetical protein